jgi:hypothetical protein
VYAYSKVLRCYQFNNQSFSACPVGLYVGFFHASLQNSFLRGLIFAQEKFNRL